MMQPVNAFFVGWEPPRAFLYVVLLLLLNAVNPLPNLVGSSIALVLATACLVAQTSRAVATKHSLVENAVCMLMLGTVLLPVLSSPTVQMGLLVALYLSHSIGLFFSAMSPANVVTTLLFVLLDILVLGLYKEHQDITAWYIVARTLFMYAWSNYSLHTECAGSPNWFRDLPHSLAKNEEPLAWHRAFQRQSFDDVIMSTLAYKDAGHAPRIDALKIMFKGMSTPSLVQNLAIALDYFDKFSDDPSKEPLLDAMKQCLEELDDRTTMAWAMARTNDELLDMLRNVGQSTIEDLQTLELPSDHTIGWSLTPA